MKLFYFPGACSLGIHLLLEEIGTPFELRLVSLKDGEQFQPDFTAVSPKSRVPVLERDDGSILTEFGAIATWLARTNPALGLIPQDPDGEARMVEVLEYVTATVHMQGWTRIFRPTRFSPDDASVEKVKARGREIFGEGLAVLAQALGDRQWITGSAMSIADAAVFYVCSWAARNDVPMPPALAAHYARMKARPAVQRALATEGLAA